MNNIAGNLAIVVEPVKEIYDSYRIALYIFFSGFVAASNKSKHYTSSCF